MSLTKAFYDAVNSGNKRMVRIMMEDSLLVDLSFEQFKEMEAAASGMKGLYEEHDGRSLNMDKSTWNDDYMNKIMVQVITNFSHERVDHLKEVVRYLRPIPEKVQAGHDTQASKDIRAKASSGSYRHGRSEYQEQKYHDQKAGDYRGAKYFTGALVGAVAGGAIAATANLAVVGGVAVGAAAGVGVVYVGTNLIGEEQ